MGRAWLLLGLLTAGGMAQRTITLTDVEKTRSGPKFNVQLLTDRLPPSSERTRTVTMRKKDGRTYLCHLPADASGDAEKDSPDSESSVADAAMHSIEQYLRPLSGSCFYRLEGWWTYEVCLLHSVRQFHQEKHVLMQDFTLGGYWTPSGPAAVSVTGVTAPSAGSAIATGTAGGTVLQHSNPLQMPQLRLQQDGKGDGQGSAKQEALHISGEIVTDGPQGRSYFKQEYGNGSLCELTGSPRHSEVRIFCAPNEPSHIASVEEVATCRYVLSLHSKALCSHPAFEARAQGEEQVPVNIRCELLARDGRQADEAPGGPAPAPELQTGTPLAGEASAGSAQEGRSVEGWTHAAAVAAPAAAEPAAALSDQGRVSDEGRAGTASPLSTEVPVQGSESEGEGVGAETPTEPLAREWAEAEAAEAEAQAAEAETQAAEAETQVVEAETQVAEAEAAEAAEANRASGAAFERAEPGGDADDAMQAQLQPASAEVEDAPGTASAGDRG